MSKHYPCACKFENYVELLQKGLFVNSLEFMIRSGFNQENLEKIWNPLISLSQSKENLYNWMINFFFSIAQTALPIPSSSENLPNTEDQLLQQFNFFKIKEKSSEVHFCELFSKFSHKPHIVFICLGLFLKAFSKEKDPENVLLKALYQKFDEAFSGYVMYSKSLALQENLPKLMESALIFLVPEKLDQLTEICKKILEDKFKVSAENEQALDDIFSGLLVQNASHNTPFNPSKN